MAQSLHGRLPSRLTCLVWAFQCLGLFCFKRPSSPSASGKAELSVPLLLWSVFMKTFQITEIVPITLRPTYNLPDVGRLTTFVFLIISTASLIVGQIRIIINGPVLCQILSECEENARHKVCSGGFSMKNLVTVIFFCSNITTILLTLAYIFYTDFALVEIITFQVHAGITLIGIMMITMMFREVLEIATKKLSVDSLLMDESSFSSWTMEADPRLIMLEGMIQEAGLLREKIVGFFLLNITALICSLILKFITYAFIIIQSFVVYPEPLMKTILIGPAFMTNITTLLHICYSAHHFSKHVQSVSCQLRGLRVRIRGEANKAQLQYLLWTLEKMETFDMGSWYCLSPNTLVSMTSFALTYLVVLLQVGGVKTQHPTADERI